MQFLNSVFHLVDTKYVPPEPTTEKSETDKDKEITKDGDKNSSEQSKSDNESKDNEKSEDSEDNKTMTEKSDVKENGDMSKEEGCIDYTIQMALTFIKEQLATLENSDSRPIRGPYLAKLELRKQLKEREKGELDDLPLESARDSLIQYYKMFGDKPCCFNDIKPYIGLLSSEEQKVVS